MRNIVLLLAFAGLASCKSTQMKGSSDKEAAAIFAPSYVPGPPTVVYKTKGDYRNRVPVTLSDDKSKIVSYPAPSDLRKEDGSYTTPTELENGYLLDNRGIGGNVAFLKMTYEEYAQLEQAPDPVALYGQILDKSPLTELCNCGTRNALKEPVETLNKLIKARKLRTTCKVLK